MNRQPQTNFPLLCRTSDDLYTILGRSYDGFRHSVTGSLHGKAWQRLPHCVSDRPLLVTGWQPWQESPAGAAQQLQVLHPILLLLPASPYDLSCHDMLVPHWVLQ